MDILTIGEILIDLTQTGKDERAFRSSLPIRAVPLPTCCSRCPTGRADGVYRQGGADAFGRYLTDVMAENGVDASGVVWMIRTRPRWLLFRWMLPANVISASTAPPMRM